MHTVTLLAWLLCNIDIPYCEPTIYTSQTQCERLIKVAESINGAEFACILYDEAPQY